MFLRWPVSTGLRSATEFAKTQWCDYFAHCIVFRRPQLLSECAPCCFFSGMSLVPLPAHRIWVSILRTVSADSPSLRSVSRLLPLPTDFAVFAPWLRAVSSCFVLPGYVSLPVTDALKIMCMFVTDAFLCTVQAACSVASKHTT